MTDQNQAQTSVSKLGNSLHGAANFLRWSTSAMLRGGRVTKFKGEAANYSPELAVVAVPSEQSAAAGGGSTTLTLGLARRLLHWSVAPVALLAGASPAFAQDQDACVEGDPGEFVCQDNGDAATDTQDLSSDGDVTVSIEDGFEIDTSGTGGDAIDIEYSNGSVTIEQASGSSTITGDQYGIDVFNAYGSIVITTGGDVTGFGNDGIFADTSGGAADGSSITIDTTAGAVAGYSDAVFVSQDATNGGDIVVTTADVTGENDGGVNVRQLSDGSTTIDTTAGDVFGGYYGIYVGSSGTGSVSITTANVTGDYGGGVDVDNEGGDVVLDTTAGTVTGGNYGIRVQQGGDGDVSITTAQVDGASGVGIEVNRGPGSGNIAIDTTLGAVTGEDNGIVVQNNGDGATTITTAEVTSAQGFGINATNAAIATDLIIDSSAGSVTAGEYSYDDGIRVRNNGTGVTRITTADVTAGDGSGEGGNGIDVISSFDTTGLEIDTSAGTVDGDSIGIRARNYGTGNTSIVTADVAGNSGDGINARDDGEIGNGVDMSIDSSVGSVTGRQDGIDAFNFDTGDLSIVTADVTGTTGIGIRAENQGADTGDLLIDATLGSIGGATGGIRAENTGTGETLISTADVSTTGEAGTGIEAIHAGTDLFIDTAAGTISTVDAGGIYAANYGSGVTSITTADVTVQTGGNAISVNHSGTDVSVDTTAGAVFQGGANGSGIRVTNSGTGNTTITTADVTGGTTSDGNGDGIYVYNESDAGDLSIDSTAGTVSGEDEGIYARNNGTGDTTITTAGVTGASDTGVYVYSSYNAANVSVDTTAGGVSGSDFGIDVRQYSFGDLTVTTADVTAGSVDGVYTYTGFDTGSVTIDTSAGTVTGGDDGIEVYHSGYGELSITTADVIGQGDDGIRAYSYGSATIDSTQGSVTGANDGISVYQYSGEGSGVEVTTADVTGTSGDGINVENSYDSFAITIDSTAGAVTGGDDGIDVYARGYDSTTDVVTGDVTGQSGAGISVNDYGEGGYGAGSILISSVAGSVNGATNGIEAQNRATGDLVITTADVTGETGDGIAAENIGETGALTVDSSAGAVTGDRNGIYAINEGTGATSITTANVTGTTADGVSMVTGADSTTLDIDTSAGAAIGGNRGIYANHGGSDALTITVGNVTGQSAEGILAITNQADADISVRGGDDVDSNVIGATDGIRLETQGADITVSDLDSVTSQAGDGLNLVSNGGDISVSDIGTITGFGGNGIFANADSGDIVIDNVGFDGGITATGGIGIAAYADNGGTVTIGTSGAVSGDAYGVQGSTNNGEGGVTIDTTNYDVTGAIGIRAVSLGSGNVSVTTANVTGTGGDGINAFADGGSIAVDTTAGTVAGLTDGIRTSQDGEGDTTIATADVESTLGNGIDVASNGGNVSIDSTAGAVSANFAGIRVFNYGTGTTTVTTADVSGGGEGGGGIYVAGSGAGIVVDSSAGEVVGGAYTAAGVAVFNDGTGSTEITVANVTGGDAGITAYNSGDAGDLDIDSTAGTVTGSLRGISASNSGSGDTTITTADVVATDDESFGVVVYGYSFSAGGNVTVDTTAGSVTAGSLGIGVVSYGEAGGVLAITTADVTATSNAGEFPEAGILVFAYGTDVVIDTTAGAVSANNAGIGVRSSAGSVTINAGDVTADTGNGIYAATYGDGTIAIEVVGQTSGGTNGIAVSTEGAAVSITNNGTLSGGDFAVLANDPATGPITLANSGMLASAIQFAAADDQLINTGMFAAEGVSDFGDGEDQLANSGTLQVAASAQIDGLELLQNSGLIDLVNGQTGTIFATSGNFVGDGGSIALDVSFVDGSSDLIVIDGAATGTTQLVLSNVSADFSFDGQVLLVDAGEGTAADAFVLADTISSTFLSVDLGFDALANDFSVTLDLSERVFEGTKIAEAAQSLWYQSADAWADYRATSRGAGASASPAWVVAYAVSASRDEVFSDTTGLGLADSNLDYEQDYFGLQGGADYSLGENLVVGVTGGYLSSEFAQDASGTRANFDVLNIGVSLSFASGGFFADTLVKYDRINGEFVDITRDAFAGDLDGSAFGARIKAGYRVGGDSLYVEPRVSLDFQKTDLDDLNISDQTFEFDNLEGLRGAAGVRLGGYDKSGSTRIGYFLDTVVVHEFDGESDIVFRALDAEVDFQNNPIGTYVDVKAGITLDSNGPLSGFFQVESDVLGDYNSFGAKAGVKVKF
ncbi:hypothetical protein [Altererythrobacter lutimaris]|uniref:Autotransporter domain-containing protein n=1 Tax=Altererythrobacter lutimaris TaxID=2743979 RepID=A0A850H6Z5_9SPHN|nr:hypothetical protein [Altererythrobacter lutimaris]NVE94937.1 hypothetical protein [Altererythrobacter lutimaris]